MTRETTFFECLDGDCGDDGGEHECLIGQSWGCGNHPACIQNFAALGDTERDALWRAVLDGNVRLLRKAISDHPDIVAYNDARNAVQLFGCGGSVIASIPVTPEFGAALALAVANEVVRSPMKSARRGATVAEP